MSRLKLTIACGDYDLVRPLKDGVVDAEGLELIFITGGGSRQRHWRMARKLEFDVCEMNAGAYFMMRFREQPVSAIPVFLHRRFRHGFIFVNTSSGIRAPRDLIGKKVGGTNFQPAGNIWVRGILEEHYGVPHRSLTYLVDRSEDVEFDPPSGLSIERIAPGKSLDAMLAEGELPAMISPDIPRAFVAGDKRIARLFSDYALVEREYFRQTGIFPIMHVNVIKREIVERYPWVATNLVQAFERSKQLAYRRAANPRMFPLAWVRAAWEEERLLLGPDPWAYGLGEANRRTLQTLIGYCHQQGLIGRRIGIEELFADTDLGDAAGAEDNI